MYLLEDSISFLKILTGYSKIHMLFLKPVQFIELKSTSETILMSTCFDLNLCYYN